MKIKLLLLTLSILSYNLSVSQRCKTNEIRNQNIASNPSIVNELESIAQFTKTFTDNYTPSSRAAVVTLPVVVHVLYRNTTQNISTAQINSQITVLNDDFRKLNSNFSSTPSAFQSIAADCEIEFCLASVDPSGNPTTGITRTSTTVSGIGNTNNWYSTANGGKDSWDVTKYINIWVCDMGSGGLLGFATIPGSAFPANSDGMVIGYEYFGTIGTATNSAPNHLGRTATHEMGHYFNLEHVWGPTNGGCNEDDFVADTPNQDQDNGGCPTFPEYDNCTATGNGINYNNYLDYSADNCMTMFTAGQKVRMLAAINGPRSGLLTSNACSPTSSLNELTNENKMVIYPNPSSSFITIKIENSDSQNEIKIVDVLGKEQINFSMNNSERVDVSNLPAGVYFVYCNGKVASKKLIITK